jgi:hypothetical protein
VLLQDPVAGDGIVTGVVPGGCPKEEHFKAAGFLLWNDERSADGDRGQDEGEQQWNLLHEEF